MKGAKDYILRLAPGRDENSSAIGIPLDSAPPGLHLSGRKRTVHPCHDQTIRHHGDLLPRNPPAAECFGNGRTHGNDSGGDTAGEPILEVETPRHLPAGDNQRDCETASETEPGQRLPVSSGMGVDHVHRMTGHEIAKQGCVVAPAAAGKGKRVYLESGASRILLQFRTGGTSESNLHAALGKPDAEMESRERGSGAAGLLDYLKDS